MSYRAIARLSFNLFGTALHLETPRVTRQDDSWGLHKNIFNTTPLMNRITVGRSLKFSVAVGSLICLVV